MRLAGSSHVVKRPSLGGSVARDALKEHASGTYLRQSYGLSGQPCHAIPQLWLGALKVGPGGGVQRGIVTFEKCRAQEIVHVCDTHDLPWIGVTLYGEAGTCRTCQAERKPWGRALHCRFEFPQGVFAEGDADLKHS